MNQLGAKFQGALATTGLLLGGFLTSDVRATPTEASSESRVYAESDVVWIYRKPARDPSPLGSLRAGQSLPLRSATKVKGSECPGGFFEVEPRGFVCLDGTARLEPTRYFQSRAELLPRNGPHLFDYALSMGAPSYRRAPTSTDAERRERKFGRSGPRSLGAHERGHEALAGADWPSLGELPAFLSQGGSATRATESRLVRRDVPFGSMISFLRRVEVDGRFYVLNADGTLVPVERLRAFRRSTFRGVQNPTLPLAWTRGTAAAFPLKQTCKTLALSASVAVTVLEAPPRDCFELESKHYLPRTLIESLSERFSWDGVDYRLGRVEGELALWAESELRIAEVTRGPVEKTKWIDFSIGAGVLVAYDGGVSQFATLASPGIGGAPRTQGDSLSDRTTPLGTYRIHYKYLSDDMSPEFGEHRNYYIADVPYTQYFRQPFAIHVAYWHENFGEPMSGGCINVSPQDGQVLFEFTEPVLPEGWYGVSARPDEPGTWLRIRR